MPIRNDHVQHIKSKSSLSCVVVVGCRRRVLGNLYNLRTRIIDTLSVDNNTNHDRCAQIKYSIKVDHKTNFAGSGHLL